MPMIKVLRQGVHIHHDFQGYTKFEPICSSTVFIQCDGQNILVDPGHIARKNELEKLLEKEGFTSTDIDIVFITHHHLDHSSNMGAFPNAQIFIGGGLIDQHALSYHVWKASFITLFCLTVAMFDRAV